MKISNFLKLNFLFAALNNRFLTEKFAWPQILPLILFYLDS